MAAIQTIPVVAAELLSALAAAYVFGRLLLPRMERGPGTSFTANSPSSSLRGERIKTLGFFFLFVAARVWLALVDKFVPEPYLDEVFHIPQAQTYCEGRFWDWDDKITTPPGLYLLSVTYQKLGLVATCTPFSLRVTNLFSTLLTAVVACQCRHLVETRAAEREGKALPRGISLYAYHTGLNIALFPVIFFFSALYYTDVVSTLVVLVAYRNHLLRLGPHPPGYVNDLWTVILGATALFMRQTNVFWVVVYMGGLEAVHVLRSNKPADGNALTQLHDPPLSQSGPEDWLFCGLTIAVAALYNPVKVLKQIWPHIAVLALFAGFIAWNGGVVLGDKSNHVATLHLAQVLYLWPLLAFFSAPLLLPSILSAITRPIQYLKTLLHVQSQRAALVSFPYTLLTLLLSLAVVKYNTIVHPFTLADNRHYMFYIFRYTIRRSETIRLSLVAAYTLARWLVWDQLAGPTTTNPSPSTRPNITTTTTTKEPTPTPTTSIPPPTSTTLLWLLTTTLSLITAPLVEPRYFILPWVFYRLLVPSWSWPVSTTPATPPGATPSEKGTAPPQAKKGSNIPAWLGTVDVRLLLETGWFVVVNAGTMWVFLMKGFVWRGEDGAVLDGGRVQRFMW